MHHIYSNDRNLSKIPVQKSPGGTQKYRFKNALYSKQTENYYYSFFSITYCQGICVKQGKIRQA